MPAGCGAFIHCSSFSFQEAFVKGTKLNITLLTVAIFAAGFLFGRVSNLHSRASADSGQSARVFEIRTYTTEAGKLDALHARFRDHTMKLFERHGMTSIGYWTPQDGPLAQNTLIY